MCQWLIWPKYYLHNLSGHISIQTVLIRMWISICWWERDSGLPENLCFTAFRLGTIYSIYNKNDRFCIYHKYTLANRSISNENSPTAPKLRQWIEGDLIAMSHASLKCWIIVHWKSNETNHDRKDHTFSTKIKMLSILCAYVCVCSFNLHTLQ